MSQAARTEVIAVARAIASKGLVTGMVGNVSVRLDDLVLITPSRVPYHRMRTRDLVAVSPTGEWLCGPSKPSRELPLHLAVYRERPDIRALVHTHSPYATAWSFLGEPLQPTTEDNSYYGIGEVRTNRPARSGSTELAETAVVALGESSLAVLLGRHGVLSGGADLDEALDVANAVEHQAQVALSLRSATTIEVGALLGIREGL